MFFDIRASPFALDVAVERRTPRVEARVRLRQIETVNGVPQPKHAIRPEEAADTLQCDGLPEVRNVVKRKAGVREVGRSPRVLVSQEARLYDLDVRKTGRVDLRSKSAEHRWRDVHRNDTRAFGRGRERKLSRPRAQIHDLGVPTQSEPPEDVQFSLAFRIHLDVVPGHMIDIQILSAGARKFVEQPARHSMAVHVVYFDPGDA